MYPDIFQEVDAYSFFGTNFGFYLEIYPDTFSAYTAYTLTLFKRLPPAQPVLQAGEQRPHQPPLRGCGRRLQL